MSGLDVEALLDSTAKAGSPNPSKAPLTSSNDDRHHRERNDRRDRDRHRDTSRDRDHPRSDRSRARTRRDKDVDGGEELRSPKSERGSAQGSQNSRKRSRSKSRHSGRRERHGGSPGRDEGRRGSGGDFYRGGTRLRSRSRSPDDDRYYRPTGRGGRRDREHERKRDHDHAGRGSRHGGRRSSRSPKGHRSKSRSPPLTEDERDRRTVFVQQLAARLRTKELIAFFEKVGPVKEAQIVKDRVSGRSKG